MNVLIACEESQHFFDRKAQSKEGCQVRGMKRISNKKDGETVFFS